MAEYTLYEGDCLEWMKRIVDGSIDLTVTSPPYDNLRVYGKAFDAAAFDWRGIINELYRLTAVGGVVVWVVGDATKNGGESLSSFEHALFARDCGFNQETMIYSSGMAGAKGSNYLYAQTFEFMFVWTKGKRPLHGRLIRDHKNKYAGTKNTSTRRRPNGKRRADRFITPEFSKRGNVWQYANGGGVSGDWLCHRHPAPFPEALANDHIISWSNAGDTVFDPMMGSGTTGKMAIRNGRNFIGIEIDPDYFQIAETRIKNANNERVRGGEQ